MGLTAVTFFVCFPFTQLTVVILVATALVTVVLVAAALIEPSRLVIKDVAWAFVESDIFGLAAT